MSIGSTDWRPRSFGFKESTVASTLILAAIVFFVVVLVLPLWSVMSRSFFNDHDEFVGLANYFIYFSTPALFEAAENSFLVSFTVTAIVIPAAFVYAYALAMSKMPGKALFYAIALFPLFGPGMMPPIGLLFIFGNQGFFRGLLFGHSLYGPIGIIIAQFFYCLPSAVIILVTALSISDARLYEVARTYGASRWRVFRTITFPGARYGTVLAAVVVFTRSLTDFGTAKVIGGQFNVLAIDVYKQVVGQQNFEMGAVVGMVLLTPALVAFGIQRYVQKRQGALLSERAVLHKPMPHPIRDAALTLFCILVGVQIVGLYGVAVWGSFIAYWPYNLSLTLSNYDFAAINYTSGWSTYITSLKLAVCVTMLGTSIVFLNAYLCEKQKIAPIARNLIQFFAILPMAIPGLVLGLGYILFFNAPWNPLNILYGTLGLLVVNSIAHFYTPAHITLTTALKHIDRGIEITSESLSVPFWITLAKVTVPISLPAILDVAIYMFVNALTTVSAVIFLYSADLKPASVAIVNLQETGSVAAAAAMSTCILATALSARVMLVILSEVLLGHLQKWRAI